MARQARHGWGRRGLARQAWRGQAWRGQVRLGPARHGRQGVSSLGMARPGRVRHGRQGKDRPGRDRHGLAGAARPAVARPGGAGEVGLGRAWQGRVRRGRAGMDGPGVTGRRLAWQGRNGMERRGTLSERTDRIGDELLALKSVDGVINPQVAVEWARRHKRSALFGALEWDDPTAGEKYRVWQIRQLIVIHIVDAAGSRRFVSLSIDRKHDGSNGYRSLEDIVVRADLREIMLADALAELERIQQRYNKLTELAPVWAQAAEVRQTGRRKRAA